MGKEMGKVRLGYVFFVNTALDFQLLDLVGLWHILVRNVVRLKVEGRGGR